MYHETIEGKFVLVSMGNKVFFGHCSLNTSLHFYNV